MGTTTNYSFPYPADGTPRNTKKDFQALAVAMDTALESVLTGQFLKLSGGTLTGSLSGTSLSLSSTLSVTGNTTLTGTLNGKIVNDLVTGPASATDNALVRFDNTTGKVVQNSGITVDDSGNITSDLTVSKAAARTRFHSASGDSYVDASGVAGTWRGFRITTGTSPRWSVYASDEGEIGSGTGSNLVLYKGTDAGGELYNLVITRSTGKWSFRDVGATAGLELGASGPRVMSGTGSPEGVVSAPVGSMWTDTAATTGAIRWIKASGTGSTGWVVEYGDTGWRNVTASMEAGFKTSNPNAKLYVRRTNDRVTWMLNETIAGSATGTVAIYVPPTGFKETVGSIPAGVHCINANTGTGLNETFYFASGTTLYGFAWTAIRHQALLSYPLASSTAWPTSLPGTAA